MTNTFGGNGSFRGDQMALIGVVIDVDDYAVHLLEAICREWSDDIDTDMFPWSGGSVLWL